MQASGTPADGILIGLALIDTPTQAFEAAMQAPLIRYLLVDFTAESTSKVHLAAAASSCDTAYPISGKNSIHDRTMYILQGSSGGGAIFSHRIFLMQPTYSLHPSIFERNVNSLICFRQGHHAKSQAPITSAI